VLVAQQARARKLVQVHQDRIEALAHRLLLKKVGPAYTVNLEVVHAHCMQGASLSGLC
jgi:hypothetical protein